MPIFVIFLFPITLWASSPIDRCAELGDCDSSEVGQFIMAALLIVLVLSAFVSFIKKSCIKLKEKGVNYYLAFPISILLTSLIPASSAYVIYYGFKSDIDTSFMAMVWWIAVFLIPYCVYKVIKKLISVDDDWLDK